MSSDFTPPIVAQLLRSLTSVVQAGLMCLVATCLLAACGGEGNATGTSGSPAHAQADSRSLAETLAQRSIVETTRKRMRELLFRIGTRLDQTGALPQRLEELVEPQRVGGLKHVPLDGWGRSFIYAVNDDGTAAFGSYGADGHPGGTGFDEDLFGPLPPDLAARTRRALAGRAEIQIDYLISGVELFEHGEKRLPESLEELFDERQYMEGSVVPLDPWGRPFVYRKLGGRAYEIVSYGADGAAGGLGLDTDIIGGATIE